MKKTLTLALIILAAQISFAQDGGETFRKFKVDISLGYGIPSGSGTKGGVIFAIEPKYAIMEQVSVGLRMEGALLAAVSNDGETGNVKALASYLATGDYYFSNNSFRPFAGLGAGIFSKASVDIDDNFDETAEIPTSTSAGFMVRGGFEYGHFRMGLEYNIVKEKASYVGVKLGFFLGGGRN